MAHDVKIKNYVRRLRSKGKTYNEILKEIKILIPKSTLSDWCQTVDLPDWYKAKVDELNKKSLGKAQAYALASLKLKQEKLLAQIADRNKNLPNYLKDKYILKLLLSILHLGEGAKLKSHRGLMLGSSDLDI